MIISTLNLNFCKNQVKTNARRNRPKRRRKTYARKRARIINKRRCVQVYIIEVKAGRTTLVLFGLGGCWSAREMNSTKERNYGPYRASESR